MGLHVPKIFRERADLQVAQKIILLAYALKYQREIKTFECGADVPSKYISGQ